MNKSSIDDFTYTAEEVCEKLNISRQTLYAYVSRGKVRSNAEQNGDARKSYYHAGDIKTLIESKKLDRSRRAIATSTQNFGEPVLKSEISEIKDDILYYHGQDAVKLSEKSTYEDICQKFLNIDLSNSGPLNISVQAGNDPIAKIISTLALQMNQQDRVEDIPSLIKHVIAAACEQKTIDTTPTHLQIARYLNTTEKVSDIIRRILVLCADHELNPSAYAARITASTYADMDACLLAALATFSGPRHGAMSSIARWWNNQAAIKSSQERQQFINELKAPPGYGHPVYRKIDPRAKEILKYFELPSGWDDVRKEVEGAFGLYPNIDFALAAFEKTHNLPAKTSQLIFAIGRIPGWIAHAIEQRNTGKVIRPRAWS